MTRKLLKIFLGIVGVLVFLIGGFVVFGMYVTRTLPWQKPVFDTARPADPGAVGDKGILIFSKTNGFRHESIEPGIEALKKAGKGWDVRSIENGAFFNDDYLSRFKVVVFLSTTGDILTSEQEKAFERFIENGGGYVGIHAASDTEYAWDWYDHMLGTHFRDHPLYPEHTPEAEIITDDRTHPTTKHLPSTWRRKDEWYNFKQSVRGKDSIKVLLTLNEATYKATWPKAMGGDHPISWINTVGQGRIFYTGMGHTDETFTDKNAFPHIVAGIEWAGHF
ncbi:ThuA domain-containing protein [Spirosoma sp. BT702]|uniref:ThuA domain-containing protein n=1 Tax=Spirosoma profusum TaxID=2771354 RepID=A0A926XSJ8_9BACT|nr:ThuA domain-containing protein [Spirosoma profusum]MBD2699124.1 ThuA domain-containing protein [Spirosoma profusum]